MVPLLSLKLNLIPYRRDRARLARCPPDQIADEETLEGQIDVAKAFLQPRERVRAQRGVNLLNNGNVVLPAEERANSEPAPQKCQHLDGFVGRRLGLSWQVDPAWKIIRATLPR